MNKGYIETVGEIVRQSDKAILFRFAEPCTLNRNPAWIPKVCFESEAFPTRYFIKRWFYKKLVDGETSKPIGKKELVKKFTRRVEADASFKKPLTIECEPEPRFYGNVDKVLDKILN